jgi:hypothetical protein
MTRTSDRVASVKIKILLSIAGVDPNALATLGNDRHFLVRRKLIALLDCYDLV